jgi:hypothetical protein
VIACGEYNSPAVAAADLFLEDVGVSCLTDIISFNNTLIASVIIISSS